jgi:hypothetical protein
MTVFKAMGMFRSVLVERTCERCSESEPFEIQFKTGFDSCETYKLGELVASDEGLHAGQTYKGCIDRYCDNCILEWGVCRRSAMLESLAQLVEAEWLRVREKGGEQWLSVWELRGGKMDASSRQPWEEYSEGGEYGIFVMPSDVHFDLVWKGVKVRFPNDACHEYKRELEERIDRALRDQGWISRSDFLRRDLLVYLDDDYRIRVA